jgi:nitrate reductase (NAD(P)H)
MQRIKDEGQDPSAPNLTKHNSPSDLSAAITRPSTPPALMTNPAVKRMITLDELQAHSTKERPWFVVDGEVRFAHTLACP